MDFFFFFGSFVSDSNSFPFVILSDGEVGPCLEGVLSIISFFNYFFHCLYNILSV